MRGREDSTPLVDDAHFRTRVFLLIASAISTNWLRSWRVRVGKKDAWNTPSRHRELPANSPQRILGAIAHGEHHRSAPRKPLEHPSAEHIEISPGDVDEDVELGALRVLENSQGLVGLGEDLAEAKGVVSLDGVVGLHGAPALVGKVGGAAAEGERIGWRARGREDRHARGGALSGGDHRELDVSRKGRRMAALGQSLDENGASREGGARGRCCCRLETAERRASKEREPGVIQIELKCRTQNAHERDARWHSEELDIEVRLHPEIESAEVEPEPAEEPGRELHPVHPGCADALGTELVLTQLDGAMAPQVCGRYERVRAMGQLGPRLLRRHHVKGVATRFPGVAQQIQANWRRPSRLGQTPEEIAKCGRARGTDCTRRGALNVVFGHAQDRIKKRAARPIDALSADAPRMRNRGRGGVAASSLLRR